MEVIEDGIKYKYKKEALLLSVLGTLGGTLAIANYLGITTEDVRNMNIKQLVKLIPAYLLSGLITNHLIAKTIRFADPVHKRKKSRKSRKSKKSRKSRKSRK